MPEYPDIPEMETVICHLQSVFEEHENEVVPANVGWFSIDTRELRVGDGLTKWKDLVPFLYTEISDVNVVQNLNDPNETDVPSTNAVSKSLAKINEVLGIDGSSGGGTSGPTLIEKVDNISEQVNNLNFNTLPGVPTTFTPAPHVQDIAHGGTGATTAEQARINLGINTSSINLTVNNDATFRQETNTPTGSGNILNKVSRWRTVGSISGTTLTLQPYENILQYYSNCNCNCNCNN